MSIITIDPERSLITLINLYEVVPEKQAELARLLAEVTERVMRHLPGFISVSIHCSLDGTLVSTMRSGHRRRISSG